MGLWQRIRNAIRSGDEVLSDSRLADAQHVIGYTFRNLDLLRLALRHRSVAHAANAPIPSNERLEFLGDSVLGLVIADQLYRDNPEMSEGDLTKTKAMLVNETTLASRATDVGLNIFVQLSSDEERAGGSERPSIISDAFESVIGAVYLDGGIMSARDVILRLIYAHRDEITNDATQRNYKGDLLELVQAAGDGMPFYQIVSESGPDHAKEFEVAVFVNDRKLGMGVGNSKKEAEQHAAAEALMQIETAPSSSDQQ